MYPRSCELRVSRSNTVGFTIVELLIVIVVIAILAAISIVAYNGIQNRALQTSLKNDLNQAAKQIEMEKVSEGSYPGNADNVKTGSTTNLQYDRTDTGFCITVYNTERDVGAFHRSNNGSIQEGPCPGHEGSSGGSIATGCPAGFIEVPGNSLFDQTDFCVMKYEAKDVGGIATSQAAGTPWVSISQNAAITTAENACDGCGLITEAQWLTIAHNVTGVSSNWTGGSIDSGSLYRGHSDDNPSNMLSASSNDNDGYSGTGNSGSSEQRRTLTLSNGEVIWDLAGNAHEWTNGQTTGGQPGQSGSGYAWRNWEVISGGTISPNPFPEYGTPAASTWNANDGIGRVLSNSNETTLKAFRRSGDYKGGDNVGVFTLYLNITPTDTSPGLGFRVTYEP